MATKKKDYKTFKYVPRLYLTKLRTDKGLSQLKLAEQIGMDAPVYNQVEARKQGSLMNARRLLSLSRALEVDIKVLCLLEADYLNEVDTVNGKMEV